MNVIDKQLDYLNNTMKETASTANSFLLKYHFGGLIAVIALLNADLVLTNNILKITSTDHDLIAFAISLIFLLSFIYFYIVLKHYGRFSRSHRKLKYKYELTLHLLLCQGEHRDYQYFMEKSVEKFPKKPNKEGDVLKIHDGNNYNFNDVAEYLLNHHRIKYQKVKKIDAKYLWMAMLVIALTISIRGIFILIGSHG